MLRSCCFALAMTTLLRFSCGGALSTLSSACVMRSYASLRSLLTSCLLFLLSHTSPTASPRSVIFSYHVDFLFYFPGLISGSFRLSIIQTGIYDSFKWYVDTSILLCSYISLSQSFLPSFGDRRCPPFNALRSSCPPRLRFNVFCLKVTCYSMTVA